MKTIFSLLLFCIASIINAQDYYVCTLTLEPFSHSIRVIDQDFNINFITDIELSAGYLLDIALSDDGTMYGISSGGVLVEVDLTNGNTTNLHFFGSNLVFTSLTFDSLHNELITLEKETKTLYRYSLNNQMVTSSTFIDASTPGDLTFYKGNLIFLDEGSLDIKTYHNEQLETIACGGSQNFYGFSNFITNCDENVLFAFSGDGKIYRYSIQGNSFLLVHDFDLQDYIIFGSTTSTEYLASECPFENLNTVNCNLTINTDVLNSINFTPNPVQDNIVFNIDTEEKSYHYFIFTLEGKQVASSSLKNATISFSKFKQGIYFLKLKENGTNSFKTFKLIKQ